MGHYDDARIKNLCGLISHESLHGTIGIHESDKASHALDYVMSIYSAHILDINHVQIVLLLWIMNAQAFY